ncbi:MAG: glycosyltransferase family 2 protein [Anaerolineae bacterium]
MEGKGLGYTMEKPELSVVMPCLNEEETIDICIEKAKKAFEELDLVGEVVVCDNGSTDDSVSVAEAHGARVVRESTPGYGAALMKGISEARGEYIIMGDADNTYDFENLAPFVGRLRDGYDLVMGSRFDGEILPGAMPWSHQYIGNPVLTGILNLFFHSGVSDAHCGMRAFTREAYDSLDLYTTGMEFASEMVIKASNNGLRIADVPITYYPRQGESKLSSVRDGWRHLRFMLLYSPTWLFLIPGVAMSLVGLLLLLLPEASISMLIGSLLFLIGVQVVTLGFYAKTFSYVENLEQEDLFLRFLWRHFRLESGVALGLILILVGGGAFFLLIRQWQRTDVHSIGAFRSLAVAGLLIIVGVQTTFSSFFLSMLGLQRK